jgi:hypothetical protein
VVYDVNSEPALCCQGKCTYEVTPATVRRSVAMAHRNHWLHHDLEVAEYWEDFGEIEGPFTITFETGGTP